MRKFTFPPSATLPRKCSFRTGSIFRSSTLSLKFIFSPDKISNLNYSIVFFISPKKIKKIRTQIQKYFNDRDILITREMTKFHEEYIRDKVKNLNNVNISEKGEITVVISENSNLENRLQVIEESVKKKIIKQL